MRYSDSADQLPLLVVPPVDTGHQLTGADPLLQPDPVPGAVPPPGPPEPIEQTVPVVAVVPVVVAEPVVSDQVPVGDDRLDELHEPVAHVLHTVGL